MTKRIMNINMEKKAIKRIPQLKIQRLRKTRAR